MPTKDLLTDETYEYENMTYSQACIEFVKMLIDCRIIEVKQENKINPFVRWLQQNGFRIGNGAQDENGWVKIIRTKDDLYDVCLLLIWKKIKFI